MTGGHKVWELVAHQQGVNCISLSRASSGLLLTGGDDKKVHVWALYNSSPILSLSAHSSRIQSVTFDPAEQSVLSGSAQGSIKMWNLNENFVYRTFSGHLSDVLCISFHHAGTGFASGSLDTNVKLWDVRHKSARATFRGHTKAVTKVKFSPDGRMLATGGEDGKVKLWDLRNNRHLFDYTAHTKAITDIAFHPRFYILVTASLDKFVHVVDLESYKQVGTIGPDTSPPRCITFDQSTRCIVAYPDGVKVINCDPTKVVQTVDASWTRVADLHARGNTLLGASYYQAHVALWRLDMNDVMPQGYTSPNQMAE